MLVPLGTPKHFQTDMLNFFFFNKKRTCLNSKSKGIHSTLPIISWLLARDSKAYKFCALTFQSERAFSEIIKADRIYITRIDKDAEVSFSG